MNANNILIKGEKEMKKITAILISVMTIAVLITFNTAIATNGSTVIEINKSGQTESFSITPEEMEKVSTLVANMANEVKRGNMTPEVQARSAEILTHVSHMLSVLASPDDKMTYSIIKREKKEVEKEWNLWDEMVEH
jgi:hypothetical protein